MSKGSVSFSVRLTERWRETTKWRKPAGAIAIVAGAVGVALHVKSPPAGDATKDTELKSAAPEV